MKYLYCIENKVSGKKYIGVTIDPERRWKQHVNPKVKKNSAIKDAINKYGEGQFTFTILDLDEDDIIDKKEVTTIAELNTQVPNGYNLTLGGDGASYRVWDDEWNSLLGTMPDTKLAEILEYHASTIAVRRTGLGIPTFQEINSVNWEDYDHLMGTVQDSVISKLTNTAPSTVGMRRQSLGIEPFTKTPKRYNYPKELINLLGKETDVYLSERFNIPSKSISRKRASLKIPRKLGYIGHHKKKWTDEDLAILNDTNILAEDAKDLVNCSISTVHRYRRENKIGKYTGKDVNGRVNYIPLEGELLEDLLDGILSNKQMEEKYGYSSSTFWAKRKSKGFLAIKHERGLL